MLFENVRSVAIGISARAPLHIGEEIDFTMGLFEGLPNFPLFKKPPPRDDRFLLGLSNRCFQSICRLAFDL